MANMKEILPKGDYKIGTVGPSRNWEFNGNAMITDQVQFVGHEQYWVDVNRKADSPLPKAGDSLTGTVEQDVDGKYSPKFKKERSGNWSGGGGGGQASPGAIWATAMSTSAAIVAGYYAASGAKPADLKEYFGKVKALAPKVNAAVDAFVTSNKKEDTKPAGTAASESGETQAPAQQEGNTVVADISDEDLGDW